MQCLWCKFHQQKVSYFLNYRNNGMIIYFHLGFGQQQNEPLTRSVSVFWGNCIPRLGMESVFFSRDRKCFIGVRLGEGERGRRNDRSGNCSTESSQISHLDSCCKIICLLQSKHREKGTMIYSRTSLWLLCACPDLHSDPVTLWMAQNMIFFLPHFNFIKSFFFLWYIPVQF